jgi:hypothetical protein
MIRKSAHGRTNLFIPNSNLLFKEIKCMHSVKKNDDEEHVYHVLPPTEKLNNVACWHCCETVESCFPIPRTYDSVLQVFHVFGTTCSPSCAKAYILEHNTSERSHHLNTLTKMLREVYGYTGEVTQSPPRPSLKMFGGPFDMKDVRKGTTFHIVEPPFISYTMIAEERYVPGVHKEVVEQGMEMETSLSEPLPPALFDQYLEKKNSSKRPGSNSTEEEPPKKKTAGRGKGGRGRIGRFLER